MKFCPGRSICRAPNRYSPSIALYQHFVVPYNAVHQQHYSSSPSPSAPAPAAAESKSALDSSRSRGSPALASSGRQDGEGSPARVKIRKFRTPLKETHETNQKLVDGGREMQVASATPNSSGELDTQARSSERFVAEILLRSRIACDEGEEYRRFVVNPIPATVLVPEQMYPWAATFSRTHPPAMTRLNREINAFYQYARPTKAEEFVRKNLVEQVRADVRQRFPDHVLEVFGSERTGLALATSDIDLRMVRRKYLDQISSDKPPTPEERRNLLRDLYTLRHKVFGGKKEVAAKYVFPTLRHARYPLLSLQDRGSHLDVQIVLSNNTTKSREFIKQYMTEFPYIRPVYAVIKTMFDQRGLSDVFHGGFGSYSIFMMIVASLQNHPNPRQNAAGALVNFLYYWANFKTREHGISIAPSEYFDKKENPVLTDTARAKIADGTKQSLPDWMLCLRDPADEMNDLGRKGTCILHVQRTLRYLMWRLIDDLNGNKRPSLLAPIVGEAYARQRDHRRRLADYGRWVEQQIQKSFGAAAKGAPETQEEETPKAEEVDISEMREEGDVHGFLDADTNTTPDRVVMEETSSDYSEAVASTSNRSSAEGRRNSVSKTPQDQDTPPMSNKTSDLRSIKYMRTDDANWLSKGPKKPF